MNYFGKTDCETIDAAEMVTRLIENVKNSEIEQGNKILRSWRAILESIQSSAKNGQNIGKNLASHSRIVDLRNGILLVEADHSAWLQMLQLHQRYILGSIQRRFPELNISTLAFRLRGTTAGLSDTYEQCLMAERAKMARRYEMEEQYIEGQGLLEKPEMTGEEAYRKLPPEIRKIFDKLKVDMLTNGE